ncbi:hypothetical protein R6Z07M_011091 [Ovis aries]
MTGQGYQAGLSKLCPEDWFLGPQPTFFTLSALSARRRGGAWSRKLRAGVVGEACVLPAGSSPQRPPAHHGLVRLRQGHVACHGVKLGVYLGLWCCRRYPALVWAVRRLPGNTDARSHCRAHCSQCTNWSLHCSPERLTPSHGTVVPAHSILIPGDEDETLEQPLNPHLMAPSPQGHKDEFGLLCGPQPLASSH